MLNFISEVVFLFIFKVLNPAERQRLAENIAGHVCNASEFLQKRVINNFGQADPEYGQMIKQLLDKINAKKRATQVSDLGMDIWAYHAIMAQFFIKSVKNLH